MVAAIVKDIHEVELMHAGGPKAVIAEVKKPFHAPALRQMVKIAVRSCMYCRRAAPRASAQRMAPLPDIRTQPVETFCKPFTSPRLR